MQASLSEAEEGLIKKCFERVVSTKESTVNTVRLPGEAMPIQVVVPEIIRRMQEMSAASQGIVGGSRPSTPHEIAINTNHPAIKKILSIKKERGATGFCQASLRHGTSLARHALGEAAHCIHQEKYRLSNEFMRD